MIYTHNNIDCLIQVHHYTILIYDWHCRDAPLREHMHHVEDPRIHCSSGDWVEGIFSRLFALAFLWRLNRGRRWGRDVRANLEFAERKVEMANIFVTLRLP